MVEQWEWHQWPTVTAGGTMMCQQPYSIRRPEKACHRKKMYPWAEQKYELG